MEGLLAPTQEERGLGRAEVRETFSVPKMGVIAGSYVTQGLVRRGALARLLRDNVQIWKGKVGSLRRFKDDVREVREGYECGLGLENYNDIKVGDIIEVYEIIEVSQKLE
jgi:translation initiation factor IF-2